MMPSTAGHFQELLRDVFSVLHRPSIIDEVLIDQKLKYHGWRICYVVDFYQLFSIAYPLMALNKGPHYWPKDKAREKIVRDRIKRAIVFYGRIDHELSPPPILLPPYKYELDSRIASNMDKIFRKEMRGLLHKKLSEIKQLDTEWNEISNTILKDIQSDIAVQQSVERLSNAMSRMSFITSYMMSLGDNVMEQILSVREPEPIIRFIEEEFTDNEILNRITDVDNSFWLEKFNGMRPDASLSNEIDSLAIEMVIEMNQIASERGDKSIYLLVSDVNSMVNVLGKWAQDD